MNRLLRACAAAALIVVTGSFASWQAIGQEIVVPKQSVDATVNDPPSAGAGEYQEERTLSNGMGSFEIMAFRDPSSGEESVQFFFDINDESSSSSDEIYVAFDSDHDENASPSSLDRGLLVQRPDGGDPGSAEITNVDLFGSPSPQKEVPEAQWSAESTGEGWTVEVKMTGTDLDLNGIPALMGMHVTVLNSQSGTQGFFPEGVSQANVADWADLKTRFPLDFMLVLDQSGSMRSQDKWENAKRSADIFANLMSILGEPEHFDDRLGVVAFNWPCSGSSDGTSTVKSLASVGSFPVGNYTDQPPAADDPEANLCTPIGEGLREAFDALDATLPDEDPAVERERAALLLSDGLQNRPETTFEPSDTGYDPCPSESDFAACPDGTISNVSVSTVAFGDGDASVDTELLSEINDRYLGTFTTTYNMASPDDVEDLKQTFIQGLEDVYGAELIHAGSASTSFTVEEGNEKLILIGSWTDPTQAEAIGAERNGSSQTCDAADTDTNVGFAVCTVEVPEEGSWDAVADDGSFDDAPDRLFVVVDLRVSARFAVEEGRHGTGEPIMLTARLQDRGQAVLHDAEAHPIDVTVDVVRPGTGVGTFASTHEPTACRTVQPRPPDPQRGQRDALTGAQVLPSAAEVARGTGDPNPPLYALMSNLLSSCGEQGVLVAGELPRESEPSLRLRDDGTNGDEVAGDGIYTLRFEDTEVAGTYEFEFAARGETTDGQSFSRTKRIAEYVRVEVSPEHSESGYNVVSETDNIVVREYFVLPQDRFEGYLGPGKADEVEFVHEGGPGSFTTDVEYQEGGSYTRRIEYNESEGTPDVTPVVQGKPIEPLPGGIPGAELGFYADGYAFDERVDVDPGAGFGGWFGVPVLGSPLYAEAELGVTRTDVSETDTLQVTRLLGNLRYDIGTAGALVPHVTAGVGFMTFSGEGDAETVLTYQAGGGISWYFTPRIGLRANARLFRMDEVRGSGGETTNLHVYVGVVLRR